MATTEENKTYTAAVITVSDRCAAKERKDESGPACCDMLEEKGYLVVRRAIVPDEISEIQREVIFCTDSLCVDLVLTTGGTGFSQRDVTPEAVLELLTRRADGIAMAMITESLKITPKAMLSRPVSGLRGESIIVTLPGSVKGALENLQVIAQPLKHGIDMAHTKGSADCGGGK